jgi:hypothetical protein
VEAVSITSPDQVAHLRDQAGELEAYAKGAVQNALGKRLAFYNRLCAVAGDNLAAWISDGSVAENDQATLEARNVALSLRALDTRHAVLVPWQSSSSSSVKFAIASPDMGQVEPSALGGLWSMLAVAAGVGVTVFLLGPGITIAGAGIYLADAYLSYATVESRAKETLQRTRENLTGALLQAQKRGDKAQAAAILEALQSADAAAANANPSWLDQIIGAGKNAAAGAFGGLAAVAVLFVLLHQRQDHT